MLSVAIKQIQMETYTTAELRKGQAYKDGRYHQWRGCEKLVYYWQGGQRVQKTLWPFLTNLNMCLS